MSELITFIHIGKTGGTAARMPLNEHIDNNPDARIELLNHNVGLEKVMARTPTSEVMFFIREPVSRFISGFNSRLRKGRPRFLGKWSPDEEKTFTLFPTPTAIAEALTSDDRELRNAALHGLRTIQHTKLDYQHYLGSVSLLEKARDKIIFIGAQESFDSDFALLQKILGMDPSLKPPQDDKDAHRTPQGYEQTISDLGRRNILEYYARDLPIYEWCKAYREVLLARYAARFGG